jgi:hypothetical protein
MEQKYAGKMPFGFAPFATALRVHTTDRTGRRYEKL